MKKILIFVCLAIILCSVAAAVYADTLIYSVSSTTIRTAQDYKATFSITIPAPQEPYGGFQIAVNLPSGASFDTVKYNNDKGVTNHPQAASSGVWYFGKYDTYSENVFSEQLVCTVTLNYTAQEPGTIVIEQIKQIWYRGKAQLTTDIGEATSITILPYIPSDANCIIDVAASPPTGGEVTGGGVYAQGDNVTLTAAANSGYRFVGWFEGGASVSAQSTYTFTAGPDRTLVARFEAVGDEAETVTVTVSANPAAGGSATGGGTYDKGANVTLTAAANSGYRFVGWFEGGVSVSASASYTFEAISNRALEARFEVISPDTPSTGGGGRSGGSPGAAAAAEPAPTIIDAPEEEPPLGPVETPPEETEFLLRLDKDRTEGYIHGYPDGTFGPNNNITRYETAVMFYNLVNDPDKASYTSAVEKFSDVPTDQWYSEAVGYLVARGVLLGYPDGEFKGENNITRAEFVTIASKFDETSLLDDISFPDVDDSHWAYDFIKSAYNNHWITGYPDGTFGPENMITRAEAVVIINRMLEWDPADAHGENPFSDIEPGDWYYNDVLLAANGR